MPKRDVSMTVSGTFRRAAALVGPAALDLTKGGDGAFHDEDSIDLPNGDVVVAVTIEGEIGATFEIEVTIGKADPVKRKGTLKKEVALRSFTIKAEAIA